MAEVEVEHAEGAVGEGGGGEVAEQGPAVQQKVAEAGYNPHAAIIARHAARKAERERAEREEQERLERLEAEARVKLKRRETVNAQRSEVQQRHTVLLDANKPLEPMGTEVQRYEGQLKGWRARYVYLEDKLPLSLKIFKAEKGGKEATRELLDSYELDVDCQLEDLSPVGSSSLTTLPDETSSVMSKKTVKSSKTKDNSFCIIASGKKVRLAADSEETKERWLAFINELVQKHHGLARSMALTPSPEPEPPRSPPAKAKHAKSSSASSRSSLESAPKKKTSSYSLNQDTHILNPLSEEETFGVSFKNELFEQ